MATPQSTVHDNVTMHKQKCEQIPNTLSETIQVAKPAGGTASRMIKSISNKSLRNLVSSGKSTESTWTKKSRPRSMTLEMLEKQLTSDGQEFRPRSEYVGAISK